MIVISMKAFLKLPRDLRFAIARKALAGEVKIIKLEDEKSDNENNKRSVY